MIEIGKAMAGKTAVIQPQKRCEVGTQEIPFINVQSRKGAPGQELIEFALVITVLMFIIVGVFDLGRAFHAVIVITNASREGARYGSAFPDDQPGMVNAAVRESQNSGITVSAADVSVSCLDLDSNGSCDKGWPVRVTVNYAFRPMLGFFLPSTLNLARYTEMMVP